MPVIGFRCADNACKHGLARTIIGQARRVCHLSEHAGRSGGDIGWSLIISWGNLERGLSLKQLIVILDEPDVNAGWVGIVQLMPVRLAALILAPHLGRCGKVKRRFDDQAYQIGKVDGDCRHSTGSYYPQHGSHGRAVIVADLVVARTGTRCDKAPPNVLRFSCRRGARHRTTSKKARSRAPKAVSCKRLLDGATCSSKPIYARALPALPTPLACNDVWHIPGKHQQLIRIFTCRANQFKPAFDCDALGCLIVTAGNDEQSCQVPHGAHISLEQREGAGSNSTATILWQKYMITDQAFASLPVNIVQNDLADRRRVVINAKVVDIRAERRSIQVEGDRSRMSEAIGTAAICARSGGPMQ